MDEAIVYAVRRSATIIIEHFDDEIVVANLKAGMYYSLRFTAVDIWNLLETGATLPLLESVLHQNYETTGIDIHEHIAEFVAQLIAQELIVESILESSEPVLPLGNRKSAYVKPELVVFDDMQDLLALDPIHDVDVQEGWPVKKQP